MKRLCGTAKAASLLVAAILAAPLGLAEVGIPLGPPGTGRPPIVVSIIGDDPDPFGTVWDRHSPPLSGAIPLNPNGTSAGDGYPSSVVHPGTGEPIVAWSKNSPSGYDIVISRFVSGDWTPAAIVVDWGVDVRDPSIAVAPDGRVHLVYWSDGADPAVWHVEAPADLSSWSSPVRVSSSGTPASRPSAVFHEDQLRVSYESHPFGFGSTPRAIVLARREGSSFTPELVALSNHSGSGDVRVGSHSGRLWVEWVDAVTATGAGEVAWVRRGAGGWETIRYVPFDSAFDREFHERPGIRLLVVGP